MSIQSAVGFGNEMGRARPLFPEKYHGPFTGKSWSAADKEEGKPEVSPRASFGDVEVITVASGRVLAAKNHSVGSDDWVEVMPEEEVCHGTFFG